MTDHPSPHHRSPASVRRQRLRRMRRPAIMGTFGRLTPMSDQWGFDRGTPIDRIYIDEFLGSHATDITGDVLEIQEPLYTRRLGSAIRSSSVLDIDSGNPVATIVADLGSDALPESFVDCAVVTQTLHLVSQLDAAVANLHRALRPGGVLLATLPAISRISTGATVDGDLWRFTPGGARVLFERTFSGDEIEVASYGNVLTAIAFLSGLAREDLKARDIAFRDPAFPVLVGVRAQKASAA